jgi:hypothetical protein
MQQNGQGSSKTETGSIKTPARRCFECCRQSLVVLLRDTRHDARWISQAKLKPGTEMSSDAGKRRKEQWTENAIRNRKREKHAKMQKRKRRWREGQGAQGNFRRKKERSMMGGEGPRDGKHISGRWQEGDESSDTLAAATRRASGKVVLSVLISTSAK